MRQGGLACVWRGCALGLMVGLLAGGFVRADDDADLRDLLLRQRRQLEQQRQQLEQLRQRIGQAEQRGQAGADAAGNRPADANDGPKEDGKVDEKAVQKVVADYFAANPGSGMPASVQTGFWSGQGFVLRSAPSPDYVKWDDESKIPFEMRIRGRLQLNYYGYKVTDDENHETGAHQQAQNANAHRFADFSQLEVKRANLIFEGTAFDPDLHYRFNLLGTTRGILGFQNNKVIQTAGAFDPNTSPASPLGGNVTVDHLDSLFEAFVFYDFHGCSCSKGCGPDCPEDQPRYCPTYTLIAGKFKPFFGLEEYMGNFYEQFVEFSMTDLLFSTDDDSRLVAAGFQVKALEDRFFLQAIVTPGSGAAFTPNSHLDDLPEFIAGFWYDLGGTWNAQKKAWDLFGEGVSDLDSSCHPVVRLGGCVDLAPLDRRSLYGDGKEARYFAVPGIAGGQRLINLLNGDGSAAQTSLRGAHAVDDFDAYEYTAFAAGKWRGFSFLNEWWVRDLSNFHSAPNGNDVILYTYSDPRTGSPVTALFPNKALLDYGMQLQAGYFLIPRRLEVAARWSWVRGDSGDVLGNNERNRPSYETISIPSGTGAAASRGGLERVQINQGAFSNFHEANEYTFGVNYFFKRHYLKWQTDFSIYTGGNPVGPVGAGLGGFLSGVDGYGMRSQIQLYF